MILTKTKIGKDKGTINISLFMSLTLEILPPKFRFKLLKNKYYKKPTDFESIQHYALVWDYA